MVTRSAPVQFGSFILQHGLLCLAELEILRLRSLHMVSVLSRCRRGRSPGMLFLHGWLTTLLPSQGHISRLCFHWLRKDRKRLGLLLTQLRQLKSFIVINSDWLIEIVLDFVTHSGLLTLTVMARQLMWWLDHMDVGCWSRSGVGIVLVLGWSCEGWQMLVFGCYDVKTGIVVTWCLVRVLVLSCSKSRAEVFFSCTLFSSHFVLEER